MSKETLSIPTLPAFEKAKSLFPLREPEPATDEAWSLYTINRREAPDLGSLLTESENEDEGYKFIPTSEFFHTIARAISTQESKMNIENKMLWKGYRMLSCDAYYGPDVDSPEYFHGVPLDSIEPETLGVISRIYSPSRPMYIDICFDYHVLPSYEDQGFRYFMAFKLHTSPAKDDFHSTQISKLKEEASENGSTSDGWRVIARGFNLPGEKNLNNTFTLNGTNAKNIRDALWGIQDDLPQDADQDRMLKRHRELVNSICILFAAIGIKSNIACMDDESEDLFSYWEVGRIRKWLARQVRRVCGFQLRRDQGNVSQDAGTSTINDDDGGNGSDEGGGDSDYSVDYDDEDYME